MSSTAPAPQQYFSLRPAFRPGTQPLLMPENSDELNFETNLPLCELELHLSAALGGQTGLLLEGPPHDSGSDSQVLVVAVVSISGQIQDRESLCTDVKPAAFQAATIVIRNWLEGNRFV